MSSFNKVLLMGNLTRDPQVKQLPSQSTVAEFGLAVNRRYKTQQGEDREETVFVDCAAFGKQAEVVMQYCRKGKPLFVEGRLKYDTWEDKNGGGTRSKLSIVVENFQFLGSRGEEGGGSFPNRGENPGAAEHADKAAAPRRGSLRGRQPVPLGDKKFNQSDIPF